MSLFVFGEEEGSLAAEAEKHNGIVPQERVANHHFPIETLVSQRKEAEAVSWSFGSFFACMQLECGCCDVVTAPVFCVGMPP